MATAEIENGQSPPGSSDYYLWEPAGKQISIRLNFNVVDQLLQESLQGLGAVPRRGVEVGGLLLGAVESANPRIIRIEDSVSVKCEYSTGPSYSLSDKDKQGFEAALEQNRPGPDRALCVVGFYRSHTRKNLFLSDADLDLCARYFPNPGDVFLLVRPFVTRPSSGGFFFWEDGKIASESSCLEFTFNRKELGGGDAPARPRRKRAEEEPEPAAEPETPERPAPRLAVRDTSGEGEDDAVDAEELTSPFVVPPARRRLAMYVWVMMAIIFLTLGGLVGFVAAPYLQERVRVAASPDPYAFGLAAASDADHVHIKWSRTAPAIQAAQGGRITITDSGVTRAIDLDRSQLQNSTVIYRSLGDKVGVRMEVFTGAQRTISESVEVKTVQPVGRK
jgi:proteasome lid subunit RPN8/RPN11